VSPQLHERYDFDKRADSVATLKNMLPRIQGPVRRRNGSRFVSLSRDIIGQVRLIPFIFSRQQAYVLELGTAYMRFYRDEGQLIDGGSPVQISTPWTIAQVQALDFAQDADTMIFVHPDVPPQILQRFSDTNWTLSALSLRPPPTAEGEFADASRTLSLATASGSSVAVTGPAGTFTRADVGRTLRERGENATGIATVETFVSATSITIDISIDFSKTSLGADVNGNSEWVLEATPVADLKILNAESGDEAEGSKGEQVVLTAFVPKQDNIASLISNGDFSSALTDWTNASGRLITSGTTTATGTPDEKIIDSGVDFKGDHGVQLNHKMINLTNPREGATLVNSFENANTVTDGFDTLVGLDEGTAWNSGDSYEVRETSYVLTTSPGAELHAGENGTAILYQAVTLSRYGAYEYKITTSIGNLSIQIGTAVDSADILDEVTITPGTTRATFAAPANASDTFTAYVQIRNNQPDTVGKVDEIELRDIGVDAWLHNVPIGTYIRLNGGYVITTATTTDERLNATVIERLDDAQDAISGSWTIEAEQWSADNGYPTAVTFFQGRLWFAAQITVWGSKSSNIRSFAFGTDDSDAVQFSPAASQVNPIHWMIGDRNLVLGTRGEEFIVSGTDTAAITPADSDVESPTAIGSEPIKPIRVRNSLLFVKAGGKRIYEFSTVLTQTERPDRDLSILAEHLVVLGDQIVAIDYQDEPDHVLWVITSDGHLRSLTYVREHNIYAWAEHTSDDMPTYRSVAVIPHPDGDRDQVWLAVKRDSSDFEHIEFLDDDGGLYDNDPATMADSVIRYSGAATSTITGLDHINTLANVYVIDALGAQGPFTVGSNQISGLARTVTEADIGINITPTMTTLRPALDGTGPTGLRLGNARLFVRLWNTGDGVVANGQLLKLRTPEDLMDSRIEPRTGEFEIPMVGYDRDLIVTLSQSIPETFEVQSIAGSVQIQDI
jgi:hypothetical protein